MKKPNTAQHFVMTLPEDGFAPFLFFLSSVWVIAEVEDKWQAGEGIIKVSLCLSSEINVSTLLVQWEDWKNHCMGIDYAVLN